jgi:hypothetical protein
MRSRLLIPAADDELPFATATIRISEAIRA